MSLGETTTSTDLGGSGVVVESPSEAVSLDLNLLWEGLGASLLDRQSVALWEEGVQNSLCLFTGTPCDMVSSSDLVGVSNHLLRASNLAFLAVCGSVLIPLNCHC